MKKVLLFLLLSFFASIGYAQSDSSKLSQNSMIYYTRPGFFRPAKFSINGKRVTFKEVNTRLANAQASASEFKQYEKYKNLTWYAAGGALASLAFAAIKTGPSNKWNTSNTIFISIGCGLIIPEMIFAGKRDRHYGRAFQLYNQQF